MRGQSVDFRAAAAPRVGAGTNELAFEAEGLDKLGDETYSGPDRLRRLRPQERSRRRAPHGSDLG
jgi:hypothetical protein